MDKFNSLFDIVDDNVGLIDLGSFYENTFIDDEKFIKLVEKFLGDMKYYIKKEDLTWAALSSIIDEDIYQQIIKGLDDIKLTTPGKTANDILKLITDQLYNTLKGLKVI